MDTQKVFDLLDSKADLEFKSQLNNDKDEFVFYEGPPFATGKPHYGHILNGILKDAICRYKNQKGYNVPRNAGWDCHGLPIENIMEKKFGLKSKKEIDNFGIGNYNSECRKMVFTCVDSWKNMARKIGRWIDFENDYKTMDTGYMECVWNVFKKINDKGLVYRGFRVMPYSISLTTPLSNFEASSNYKMTNDICATVKFKLNSSNPVFSSHSNINILVWTTTPWTLPGNTCLAVNNNIVYQVFILNETNEVYLCSTYYYNEKIKDKHNSTLLFTVKGNFLVGENYTPVFNYNNKIKEFKIYNGDFVNSEKGTGIVHIAPAFGEDDFNLCKSNNILGEDFSNLFLPVDINGIFTDEVPAYSGTCIFDADSDICKDLKKNSLLFKKDTINHSYPFCWRSDTKLMYRAVDSWFINVEKIKDRLVENNKKVNWVPNYIGHNRFHNWLEGARDWNISRKRYWGCTIPIWVNENDSSDYIVIGSISELELLSGIQNIDDLHRDSIDNIVINKDGNTYTRIADVFDCWFESGSMPYARNGDINNMVLKPAEFICEGLDQTRGWFYTLLIIATILDNKAPFKNVIVNGLILAEDGKKMSKKLQNYPDPNNIIKKYGSDALRIYLLFSPSAYAEPLRFKDSELKVKSGNIIIALYNSLQFYLEYYNYIDSQIKEDILLRYQIQDIDFNSTNISDNWIKCKTMGLSDFISSKLDKYEFSGIGQYIQDYIENLNNIYIKLNRHRFKNVRNIDDCISALMTLKWCLHNISIVMAPFTPFLSHYIYNKLGYGNNLHGQKYSDLFTANISDYFAESFRLLNIIINEIRKFRGNNISGKYPIKNLIINIDLDITNISIEELSAITDYIKKDCNIENIEYNLTNNLFITDNYRANFKEYKDIVGPKNLASALKDANKGELKDNYEGHVIEIGTHIVRVPKPRNKIDKKTEKVSEETGLILKFDLKFTNTIRDKFIFNQVKASIQKFRKDKNLSIKDTHSVNLYLDVDSLVYYDKILPDQLENTNILILTKKDIANKDLVSNFSVQMDNKKNNIQTMFISLV